MKPGTRESYQERMLRVLVHIARNLDGDLDLDSLASVACFSTFHFHRIFRGMVGESVMRYIRRLRLERAAGRLKLSENNITDIAFDAGFESLEAFSRAFKSQTGLNPKTYRHRKRVIDTDPALAAPDVRTGTTSQTPFLDDGGKDMKVEIKNIKPIRAAFMRHVGPYDQVGETWDRLCMELGTEGELGPGVTFFGICYDDPDVTPADKIRYDACISVDDKFAARGEVGVQTVDGGDYAVTTHFGPYHKLNETYAKFLGQWLPNCGRELRALPCLEFYLNDPEGTDPEDLITDIYAPLESTDL